MSETKSLVGGKAMRKVSMKRKILFTLLCALLFLFACEAGLRLRAWIKYGDASPTGVDGSLVYKEEFDLRIPVPGYESQGRNSSVKINSLGFRGDEFPVAKPAGTVRIACLGASTTFGTGVSCNEAAWPQQLQAKLQQKYPQIPWHVINGGVPGHRMADALRNLKHRLLPLQPDLVLFYEANNQMASDTLKIAREQGTVPAGGRYLSPTAEFLSNHSLLFDLGYKNLRILGASNDTIAGKLNGLPPDLPKGYVDYLAKIHGELQDRSIPLMLSTFFVKYRRDQERAAQIANADVALYYMPWMGIDDLLDGIDAYNRAIVDYGHAHAVPVVADTTSIPPDAKHFVDCVHFADAGCARMADRMLAALEKTALLQRILDQRQTLDPQ